MILPKSISNVSILILVSHLFATAWSEVPHIVKHQSDIVLMIGDTLQLECPIESTVRVIYYWKVQNMAHYQISNDPHFQLDRDNRRLKVVNSVTPKDSGTYECQGVTGFGARKVKFKVLVLEKRFCAKPTSSNPNWRPPCLYESVNHGHTPVERTVGQSVELSCRAIGVPPPKYMWSYGKNIADWIHGVQGVRGPVLKIEKLRKQHGGQYTCRVENEAGMLNYTYRLIVKESPSNSPRLLTILTNRTEMDGTDVSMLCKVQCKSTKPIIQWLKRVTNEESEYYKSQGKHIVSLSPKARTAEQDEKYVVMDQYTSVEDLGNGIYLSKLHFNPVSEKDAGKYIIMTMNPNSEIDYQVMYLNIEPSMEERNNLAFYIAIPVLIFCGCLGAVICIISRKRHQSRSYRHSRPLGHHLVNGTGANLLSMHSSSNGDTKLGHNFYTPSTMQSPGSQPTSLVTYSMGPPPPPPGSVSTGHVSSHYKYSPHTTPHYDQYVPVGPTIGAPVSTMNGGSSHTNGSLGHYYYPGHQSNSSNGYSMHQYPA